MQIGWRRSPQEPPIPEGVRHSRALRGGRRNSGRRHRIGDSPPAQGDGIAAAPCAKGLASSPEAPPAAAAWSCCGVICVGRCGVCCLCVLLATAVTRQYRNPLPRLSFKPPCIAACPPCVFGPSPRVLRPPPCVLRRVGADI